MPAPIFDPSHDTHNFFGSTEEWKEASKTKSIKAKPVSQIVNDSEVFAKLSLQTIEVQQSLRLATMICLGIVGEMWSQTKEKLLKTYSITDIDAETGWLTCTPRPENSVLVRQYTGFQGMDSFIVCGLWGEEQPSGQFWQRGGIGDYVARSKTNPTDIWIVAKNIFDSTYEIKS
jgi:hypothetical protein